MTESPDNRPRIPKPHWLKRRLPTGPDYEQVRSLVKNGGLHTVCQEAKCPNLWECFSCRTATFLILGPRCTRNCRFCAVEHGPLAPPDPGEPARVAEAVHRMGLSYVVITSVTRDDIPDGGAGLFAETIERLRAQIPGVFVEVLIPDFQGDAEALRTVVTARPDVLNHNVETVPRLYPRVRPEAIYRRSLELLRRAGDFDPSLAVKSGLMLGLGNPPKRSRGRFRTSSMRAAAASPWASTSSPRKNISRWTATSLPRNSITGGKRPSLWVLSALPPGPSFAVPTMPGRCFSPSGAETSAEPVSRGHVKCGVFGQGRNLPVLTLF